MNAEQLRSLQPALEAWVERFRVCFKRQATFEHFRCYLLGLMADLKRKSIEPIALAAGVPVRTLQEFLSYFAWDHRRVRRLLVQTVVDRAEATPGGIVVLDATGHPKRGGKTPGVQHQYCGEVGKVDNCVVAQHLLYTDHHQANPFCCMLATDLFLPEGWEADRVRCREAGIPDDLKHRTKWRIALDQLREAVAAGLRPAWVVFDEDYGRARAFWLGLNDLGQVGVGEVPPDFRCWVKRPACTSVQACHAARRVDTLATHSPAFRAQRWGRCIAKQTTRGECLWEYKAARVHLPDADSPVSEPTDRMYWLVVMRQPATGEIKYVLSNAPEGVGAEQLLRVLLSRWHIEKWFERAKQEVGLGAFEVRTYTSLIRHWLCAALAMGFLAEQTTRLRGEKPADHLRASDRGGEHALGEDLADLLALVG